MSSKRSRLPAFDIEQLACDHPNKADILRELHCEYLNRVFLPDLWRVRQLMSKHCEQPPRLRSRATAERPLFQMLAQLEQSELESVFDEMNLRRSGKTDLGLIADAILRRTG